MEEEGGLVKGRIRKRASRVSAAIDAMMIAGIQGIFRGLLEDERKRSMQRIWVKVERELMEQYQEGVRCYQCREGRHEECSGVATNPLEFHRLVTCECPEKMCEERKWEVE